MQIDKMQAIKPLWDTMPTVFQSQGSGEIGTGIPVFSDIFNAAVSQVKETDAEKNKAEYLMATGQLDNPAIQSIASSKAALSLDLLIQLRNRALDTYSELSRMSV